MAKVLFERIKLLSNDDFFAKIKRSYGFEPLHYIMRGWTGGNRYWFQGGSAKGKENFDNGFFLKYNKISKP